MLYSWVSGVAVLVNYMESGVKRYLTVALVLVLGSVLTAVAQDNINPRAVEDIKAFFKKVEEGDTLFNQKKYAEARIWIEKAIKNNSSSGIQYEHYGDILFHLGEKDFAVEQWEKAKGKGIKSVTLEKKINEKKFFE